jgi:uncharacterized protein
MKLHADKTAGNYIQSYRDGAVLVNGQWHATALIVSAESITAAWQAPAIEALSVADLATPLPWIPR